MCQKKQVPMKTVQTVLRLLPWVNVVFLGCTTFHRGCKTNYIWQGLIFSEVKTKGFSCWTLLKGNFLEYALPVWQNLYYLYVFYNPKSRSQIDLKLHMVINTCIWKWLNFKVKSFHHHRIRKSERKYGLSLLSMTKNFFACCLRPENSLPSTL